MEDKMYNIDHLKNILLAESGYIEKSKNCPTKNLYEKTGAYDGSDNWTKYWKDLADLGLTNYQGSYYCIAALFWGMTKAYGLETAQKLCLQSYMINCQTTYNLFKSKGRVFITPKYGDIMVFWNGTRFYHAEFVLDVKGDVIKTFGANTSVNSSSGSALRNGGGCYAPKTYSLAAVKREGHKFCRPIYGDPSGEKWMKSGTIWKYQLSDGSTVKNQWKYINNRWYVFNSSGAMVTGWYLDSNNQWYYLCGDGGMAQGWQKVNDKWYYLNQSGEMHKGWLQTDNGWYYLTEEGSAATGWLNVQGIWYVFDNSGKMICNTWFLNSDGNWYYLSSTGAMKTSQWIQQPDGNWYYLSNTGKMAKNAWIKDRYRDVYYFADRDGIYRPEKDTSSPAGYSIAE
ncbi:hypothetical protein GPL15_20295 [Clostridium sp. MCC353]|nr:hypothetical protein [Clostridium sp. MCC353]